MELLNLFFEYQGYIKQTVQCSTNQILQKFFICIKDLIFRDPQLYPVTCTRSPPCDKMFASEASEANHLRSGRCTTFVCTKCGDTFKDNSVKLDHLKMCEMFRPVDENVLAEIAVAVTSNSDILAEAVTLDDMDIDLNNIDFQTIPTFHKI